MGWEKTHCTLLELQIKAASLLSGSGSLPLNASSWGTIVEEGSYALVLHKTGGSWLEALENGVLDVDRPLV